MATPMMGAFTAERPASTTAARLVVAMLLAWLALSQAVDIRVSQLTGLSTLGDPYGEADAIRSADHYVTYGFTADAGLPHTTYGTRFAGVGQTTDPVPLPGNVYITYPPLPNLLCGLYALAFGFGRLWLWRCVPVAVTLAATFLLWTYLRRPLGDAAAAAVTVLASAPPMVSGYMDGLQYHAYAHALLLVELGLLARAWLTDGRTTRGLAALLVAIGFIQGWLSFEYAFVVAGAAVPLALLANARGRQVRWQPVMVAVVCAGGGFALAHALHFAEVAAFFGSARAAVAALGTRAAERLYGDRGDSYPRLVALGCFRYGKLLWLSPNDRHFGIFLPAASAWLVVAARQGRRWWSADALALASAYALGALWLVAMPSHSIIHAHFVPRIFFVAYFVAVVGAVSRVAKPAGR